MVSPHAVVLESWRAVLAEAAGALVFVDAAGAQSLHWGCGAASLLRAGALAVRGLQGPGGGADQPLALLLLGAAPALKALRALLARSRFRRCVLFLAVKPGEEEGHEELQELLRRGMGAAGHAVDVRGLPGLGWAPLAPHLLLSPDLPVLLAPPRPEPAAQLQARSLARPLAALLQALGLREESFALGPLSRLIAAELAADPQAKSRRKAAPNRGALLLIDRRLDLTGAVGHHGDNLAEKIFSVLPKLPGHTNDVAVNMVELTALRPDVNSSGIIAPGCLAQPNDPAAKALWESMLSMKHKEAVMEVRRHLVEAASRENLPIKMSMGRVTPEQLGTYVQLFKNNLEALENHCGLLQLGLATAQTLKHPGYAKWDNFLAFERLLLQNLGESDLPKVLSQLRPMIKSHSERKEDDYSPEDLLVLLVYMYSVAGEIQLEKELDVAESEIKKALVRVFSDEPDLSSLLQKITGCESSPELTFQKANIAVDGIFKTLREITRARAHMKQFSSVYVPGSNTNQASYKPLLKQVIEEIFHPDRPDTPDIEHISSGLTDLLKTGFSMFMKVSRPHPSDYPLLILFMVGGVTISEVKMVKDLIAAQKPNVQVIIMSTRLLKPHDIPELLFAPDRLHPDIGI